MAELTEGPALQRFTRLLGHDFRDIGLLELALTHRSAPGSSNERLEFLGDGLLNFVVADTLYHSRPDVPEGDLSRLRASVVCEESLARQADRLGLGDVLILGAGELRSGGQHRASILADSLEAVLGAVYLDGGFAAGEKVCVQLLGEALEQLPHADSLKDPKTRLQEFLQGHGRPLPIYVVQAADGPPHRQQFTVQCRLADGDEVCDGHAGSRKAAEQDAAAIMLNRIQEARHA